MLESIKTKKAENDIETETIELFLSVLVASSFLCWIHAIATEEDDTSR